MGVEMTSVSIVDKLISMGVSIDSIILGDFDVLGEYAAKRTRTPGSVLYNRVGCFYRANYERGILAYYLVKAYGIKSILEIGFGRGYFSLCAAKAMHDMGIDGTVISIDPRVDENHLKMLKELFPHECARITLIKGQSSDVLKSLDGLFELVYIDGDHTQAGVASDWALTKDRFTKFLLFDDYTFNVTPGMECKLVIDQIDESYAKQLIIMDRKLFIDDRQKLGDMTDGGQVLVVHPNYEPVSALAMW